MIMNGKMQYTVVRNKLFLTHIIVRAQSLAFLCPVDSDSCITGDCGVKFTNCGVGDGI